MTGIDLKPAIPKIFSTPTMYLIQGRLIKRCCFPVGKNWGNCWEIKENKYMLFVNCVRQVKTVYTKERAFDRKGKITQNRINLWLIFCQQCSQRNWKKWVFDYRYFNFLQLYGCSFKAILIITHHLFFHNTLELWKSILYSPNTCGLQKSI